MTTSYEVWYSDAGGQRRHVKAIDEDQAAVELQHLVDTTVCLDVEVIRVEVKRTRVEVVARVADDQ